MGDLNFFFKIIILLLEMYFYLIPSILDNLSEHVCFLIFDFVLVKHLVNSGFDKYYINKRY